MALVVAIAIAGSLLLTPLARVLAWRFDAVSRPDGDRRLHAKPTALWGGGAVYLAVLLGVAASYRIVPGTLYTVMLLTALGLSTGMLCVLGCYDDCHELRARWKLLGQVICTLPIVLAGYYVERITLLGYGFELGWMGILFTMGWLVLGINALNLVDGMDGLASTVGIAISLAVAVISLFHGVPETRLLAMALAGALAGFLVYNLPPARIYLGDCGSMVIGLAVSVLALQVSLAGPRTSNVTIAASLLFVPLLDTGLAVLRRALNGQGLMVADRGHVHHRLLDRGVNIWTTLGLLGAFCLISGTAAGLVAYSGHELWAWGILATLTIWAVNRRLLGHEEWRLLKRFVAQGVAQLGRRSAEPGMTASPPQATIPHHADKTETWPRPLPVIQAKGSSEEAAKAA
ncbi:MAG: undecaprenyl/decaprenyl-phosphate alpha-N-acetylglucosaminyl 1-phosphate transferase [Pirellulales bacterium]|nr:undecaprenyl/decaprenyl-phosphate alpha-N-acetylglucosaminyl 1-phosphate transferase [Pirellulales bacterium]